MINFKNAIVEEELKHIMFALQNPENANNVDKCNELMERYKKGNKFRASWLNVGRPRGAGALTYLCMMRFMNSSRVLA